MLKKHVGNTKGVKLNMIFFFFQAIESIKKLKIESIGYNVGGHCEIHWGCCGLWGFKYFIFIYF